MISVRRGACTEPTGYYKTIPTHNATQPLKDFTGGNISDYKQLHLEPQKALYYPFHVYILLPKTRKHTLNV